MKGRTTLIVIALCGLAASGVGLLMNVSGLFFTPIAEELGLMKGTVSMTLTVGNICFSIGGLLCPKVISRFRIKWVLIAATALMAGGTAMLSLCNSIILMYIFHAIRGLAAGLAGFVFITLVINQWVHKNVGFITSITMGFSGLAGALFSPVVSSIIQKSGWRTAYLVIALFIVLLNLPAIFFVPPMNVRARTKGEEGETEKSSRDRGYSITMVVIVAVYSACACGAAALAQHFPGIVSERGLAAAVGATMLSISMIMNTGGKMLLGILVDKIGARRSLPVISILVTSGLLLMMFVPVSWAMYVAAALYGLCFSMSTVGVVSMTRDRFGLENYAKTYPTISLCGSASNAVFTAIIGFIYDGSGSYRMNLIMILCMEILAFLIIAYVYHTIAKAKKA
ncbi:MAG: MFS transporter [Firmicutes bacterium]|nr:MFS transporter [Bacillota bacterium]